MTAALAVKAVDRVTASVSGAFSLALCACASFCRTAEGAGGGAGLFGFNEKEGPAMGREWDDAAPAPPGTERQPPWR